MQNPFMRPTFCFYSQFYRFLQISSGIDTDFLEIFIVVTVWLLSLFNAMRHGGGDYFRCDSCLLFNILALKTTASPLDQGHSYYISRNLEKLWQDKEIETSDSPHCRVQRFCDRNIKRKIKGIKEEEAQWLDEDHTVFYQHSIGVERNVPLNALATVISTASYRKRAVGWIRVEVPDLVTGKWKVINNTEDLIRIMHYIPSGYVKQGMWGKLYLCGDKWE